MLYYKHGSGNFLMFKQSICYPVSAITCLSFSVIKLEVRVGKCHPLWAFLLFEQNTCLAFLSLEQNRGAILITQTAHNPKPNI